MWRGGKSSMGYWRSSIGKKQVQAVAGLFLCGFLVVHLMGNFLLLKGERGEAFNAYVERLASFGLALYMAEAGLAACFLIHIGTGLWLALENRRARPVKYAVAARSGEGATLASRTMWYRCRDLGLPHHPSVDIQVQRLRSREPPVASGDRRTANLLGLRISWYSLCSVCT
jgi:succinate dehydrogenase/fumarate reductase cytochrome b subunit